MNTKQKIYEASKIVLADRMQWQADASQEKEFKERGGIVYPYDTISANIEPLFKLIESTPELTAELEGGGIHYIADVGCANGDLSFTLALAGYNVTAIDYSYGRDQAPTLVSNICQKNGYSIAVADLSVDRTFSFEDLSDSVIFGSNSNIPNSRFDLLICLGVLYHLKNPYAFLESIAGMCRYAIVGTHLLTHTPGVGSRISDYPCGYLVGPDELNKDPTNYWILTEPAFVRIAERSGFDVIGKQILSNNDLGIGVPDRTDLGIRGFLALKPSEAAVV